ncbi:hypothetical protein [Phenylobacterium aquaticum]|uniref:hypothetical protein n=1 Tax=Phenylobacterium aquaticum TaxID=1763816 RepID=UPI003014D9CC
MTATRHIHLVRRPKGVPVLDDFALVAADCPDAGEGEIQVAAVIMSVDPYMRPRLDADQPLGAPCWAAASAGWSSPGTRSSRRATSSAMAPASRSCSSPMAAASRC